MTTSDSVSKTFTVLSCGLLVGFYLKSKTNLKKKLALLNEKIEQQNKQKQFLNQPIEEENPKKRSDSSEPYDLKDYQSQFSKNQAQIIFKICITGGPCGGKTTSLAFLSEKLRERGYNVFIVPEASTMIFLGGGLVNIMNHTEEDVLKFQMTLMRLQMSLESTFDKIAKLKINQKTKTVILCDRGLMDGKAYMSQNQWETMLAIHELNEVNLRDKRYDAVFHLVSAADGAEEFYTLENQARHESIETAKEMDGKTQNVWLGHPNFEIIDNRSIKSFSEKMQNLHNKVCKIVGLPFNEAGHNKKFFLDTGKEMTPEIPKDIQVTVQYFDMVDMFLKSTESKGLETQSKISTRGRDHVNLFVWVQKTIDIQKGVKVSHIKRNLEYRDYRLFQDYKDESRLSLEKQRRCFMYQGVYMIIDTYPKIGGGFSILKIRSNDITEGFVMPNFVNVKREITDDPGYKVRRLAKQKWYPPAGDIEVISFRKFSNDEERKDAPRKQSK